MGHPSLWLVEEDNGRSRSLRDDKQKATAKAESEIHGFYGGGEEILGLADYGEKVWEVTGRGGIATE
jgi:hypothetical protein